MASTLNSDHELDNGIYDPKASFLKSILNFAGNTSSTVRILNYLGSHLTTQSMITKKGILLLVYSDLSVQLGLQSPTFIEELCKMNNLRISSTHSKPFFSEDHVRKEAVDPLYKYKKASSTILYEITLA